MYSFTMNTSEFHSSLQRASNDWGWGKVVILVKIILQLQNGKFCVHLSVKNIFDDIYFKIETNQNSQYNNIVKHFFSLFPGLRGIEISSIAFRQVFPKDPNTKGAKKYFNFETRCHFVL